VFGGIVFLRELFEIIKKLLYKLNVEGCVTGGGKTPRSPRWQRKVNIWSRWRWDPADGCGNGRMAAEADGTF
jgi:hypothetical protein